MLARCRRRTAPLLFGHPADLHVGP
jgi:hypothetical protein